MKHFRAVKQIFDNKKNMKMGLKVGILAEIIPSITNPC